MCRPERNHFYAATYWTELHTTHPHLRTLQTVVSSNGASGGGFLSNSLILWNLGNTAYPILVFRCYYIVQELSDVTWIVEIEKEQDRTNIISRSLQILQNPEVFDFKAVWDRFLVHLLTPEHICEKLLWSRLRIHLWFVWERLQSSEFGGLISTSLWENMSQGQHLVRYYSPKWIFVPLHCPIIRS